MAGTSYAPTGEHLVFLIGSNEKQNSCLQVFHVTISLVYTLSMMLPD